MSFLSELIDIKKYLKSIRFIDTNISIDVMYPIEWIINDTNTKNFEIKVQDTNDEIVLISYIFHDSDDNVINVLNEIKQNISFNNERKEKENLLKETKTLINEKFSTILLELEEVIKDNSLENVKKILDERKKVITGFELVGKRNKKGRLGNNEPQEEINS